MKPSPTLRLSISHARCSAAPIIQIRDATFYRHQPSLAPLSAQTSGNPPLFRGLNFELPSSPSHKEHWAIVGPSNAGKTTLLEILRGEHLCFPPAARLYPYLSSDEILAEDPKLGYPGHAFKYVGFSAKERGLSGIGSHLSARYESRREVTDFTLLDLLTGNTQLNVDESLRTTIDESALSKIVQDLKLEQLLATPVSNLSNGQTRRARIAKSLLERPQVLMLDEPFMGLDPPSTTGLNPLLRSLAYAQSPRIILALRIQDPIPDWITHLIYLGEDLRISHQGTREHVEEQIAEHMQAFREDRDKLEPDHMPNLMEEFGRTLTDRGIIPRSHGTVLSKRTTLAQRLFEQGSMSPAVVRAIAGGNTMRERSWAESTPVVGDTVVEMRGVRVQYADKLVLGNWDEQHYLTRSSTGHLFEKASGASTAPVGAPGLFWNVKRGERWAVTGPNGCGKTTLLSMILSDHPQAYSQPMELFGRSRLPRPGQPGISVFDLQRRIGHASPEVHAFFPRSLTVRQTLESAYADTPMSRPNLSSAADERISACLQWFRSELNPSMGMARHLKEMTLRRKPHQYLKKPYANPANPEDYAAAKAAYYFDEHVEAEADVEWADELLFSDLTFTGQRVALFLRAIVAQPDIIILDEALSGLDDVVRDKCLLFLDHGESWRLSPFAQASSFEWGQRMRKHKRGAAELKWGITIEEGLTDNQALIVVSHVKEEIPACVRDFLALPDPATGNPCRIGHLTERPLRNDAILWSHLWGFGNLPKPRRKKDSQRASSKRPGPSPRQTSTRLADG